MFKLGDSVRVMDNADDVFGGNEAVVVGFNAEFVRVQLEGWVNLLFDPTELEIVIPTPIESVAQLGYN